MDRDGMHDSARHAPLRIGVVGLGYWGPNLARNLADSVDFELAYLCDLRADALGALASRYPATRCTSRFEEI